MFEDVTYEAILERMLGRVSNKFDKREGSVIWDTHSPTALELQYLYIELERVLNEAFGDTASRYYLIRRCKERGITPFAATKAILKGVFTPTNINVTGKRFNISDMNFIVLDKISDGVYRVQCETEGITGNQYLGVMTPIDYIDGLETAELTEILIPGEDEEDTEDLRTRYFNSFSDKAFGGNVEDYKNKVNALDGVGGVKVTRVWNGDISPADLIPSDAVKEWYESTLQSIADGTVKKWLSTVYTAATEKKLTVGGTVRLTILNSEYDVASSTLVDSVQSEIDPTANAGEGYGVAPIGHVVNVQSAKQYPITVVAKFTFNDGYNWNGLQTTIENTVSQYLLELRKEWANEQKTTVLLSQVVARLVNVTGVVNITDVKINDNASDLSLAPYDVPVLGGVINDG